MDKIYKYNPLFLWFKNPETEKKFNLSSFKEDLYALRFVIILGTTLSIIFIFVDVIRYKPDLISIIFRGGMALILMILGGLTFLFKQEKYQSTQYMGILIALFVSTVFFLHYHFNNDPAFNIFLSNILMVIIFITSTIMGMRFRYALMVNTINFVGYILYVENIKYSAIAERQISQLFVIYLVGILASYLLDRQKMTSFINKNELGLEVQKVDELNKVKNKLFSIISHDLRGPIVSLKGILSLYKKGGISEEEFKQLTNNLENEFDSSSYLLDNLLAWSKTQLQGLEIKKTTINLHEELLIIKKLFESQLKAKKIDLVISITDNENVLVDKESIQIVFRNIISNAIKFTPFGGKISISSKIHNDEMIKLEVSDSGIGIPPEKLQQLFEISKDTLIGTSSSNGAGIGLLLVKEFVELNDGQVTVDSILGKGTSFRILLPTK
ncbi:HAMP domain-containing sensor histidine kinase [Marivirga salinae]|uniref:histidine kinase n=1 Tax=Marivirga salinarum TaxID=3059078 RepID=A0AA51N9C3_9BACT|nr:HAMP domain-containing sensor histidine kinase [Marivirga sp. BDSF4-3]WMN10854.1 HAMP domain-containing sensor histidine kinase [Marivirga sp. BDSF4-3]